MFILGFILFVLAPHYSNVTAYAQVCLYAIVWLSSDKTMVSILHVDLISCWCLVPYTPEVGSGNRTYR